MMALWKRGRRNLRATIPNASNITDPVGGRAFHPTVCCGTPVVAFRVGGIPDVVRDGETGYLARVRDVEGLSEGLRRVLLGQKMQPDMADQCRRVIEVGYTRELELQRLARLYDDMVRERAET